MMKTTMRLLAALLCCVLLMSGMAMAEEISAAEAPVEVAEVQADDAQAGEIAADESLVIDDEAFANPSVEFLVDDGTLSLDDVFGEEVEEAPAEETPEEEAPEAAPDTSAKAAKGVRRRALVIGQQNYEYASYLPGSINDAKSMTGMLKGLKNKFKVRRRSNLTASQIRAHINSWLAKGSKAGDVSVFYYSGHGCRDTSYYSDYYQGALCGVDGSFLPTAELASALNKVKGKVIVIIEACHAGALISSKGSDPFAQNVVNAFAPYKLGADDVAEGAKSAELRKKKFTVLVASSYSGESWWSQFDGSGYYQGRFTAAIIKGMGARYPSGKFRSSAPADTNHNKKVTLKELYVYVKKQVKRWQNRYVGSQTTMKYGGNSTVLFTRK